MENNQQKQSEPEIFDNSEDTNSSELPKSENAGQSEGSNNSDPSTLILGKFKNHLPKK